MPPSAPPTNPLNLLHPHLAPASGARINPLITNNMANNSPNPMLQGAEPHLPLPPSRKVHVVYYLSRSGQLEHPHLLEVAISPNEGLYLRDVKKRLAMIRGKRLPSTFAWSYKRSYKNGYVWQDLCDDDLIFPAHGCEYVLKGSEILMESNIAAAEKCRPPPPAVRLGTHSGPQEEEQGLISINPKLADRNYEELAVNPNTLQVSMVESGTDAATQTEEELRVSQQQQHEHDSKDLSINHNLARIDESSNISTGETSRRPQNATELNKADITSPPSSSSTNSPSPYNNMARSSRSSSSGVTTAADQNDSINPAVNDDDKIKINDNNGSCKTPGRSWMKRKEEQNEIIMSQNEGESSNFFNNAEAAAKIKYNSLGNALMAQELEAPPPSRPSRGKHSGALSLLQFMSCGGLDIKEQILPMSLYQLRTRGAHSGHLHSMISAEHMCEVFCAGSEAYHSPKPCKIRDNYGAYDVDNHYDNHHHHQLGDSVAISSSPVINMSSSAKSVPASVHMRHGCRTPKSLRSEAGVQLQDVISIGRSSISDRSTNVSHELEYQTHAHSKMKRSGEIMNVKGSPRVSRELLSDYRNVIIDSPSSARAVSGEIMTKGSPLFVPGRPYINAGTTNGMNIKQSSTLMHSNEVNFATKLDPQIKPSSTTTSRAFSEGELSSMLAKLSPNKHNFISKSGEKSSNGYDQSMAQIWEELLQAPPAKDELKEGDYHRRQIMANLELDRERTLQNAVDLSLPPAELLVLQECPHCCRKVKPELLKSHMKNCSSQKSNNKCNNLSSNNNSNSNNTIGGFLGKPPKPDSSNLCQRFLRASPPSTK